MPLKVWQFDPAQITPYYNLSLCEALASIGCDVRYISSHFLYDDKLEISDAITADYHYFNLLNDRRWLRYPSLRKVLRAASYPFEHVALARKIAADPPDVFHVQWSRLPLFDSWLLDRVKALNIPVVYTVHEIIPLFTSEAVKAQLGQVYRKADALLFHTDSNREDFHMIFPDFPRDHLHVIPHLTLNNAVAPAGATREMARERLNFPNDVPIFLFFGSLRPYKGVDVLIDAFARVAQKRPDARLMIVGNPGSREEIPSLDKLGKFRSHLYMRPEYVPFDQTWLYHLAADVIVLPYRTVYQSGALLTSMGYARPVIVTDVGGFPETVEGNGWIVPPENPARLAEAMLDAISDPERLARMGQRSLELLNERHNPITIARQLVDLYQRLVQAAPATS
ncbi:MAG: glycosyltransferase family 4 protein [Anaerolinea sp.]|nr:glycosyltransferase family 4 protein [Anaerolinea sp.]